MNVYALCYARTGEAKFPCKRCGRARLRCGQFVRQPPLAVAALQCSVLPTTSIAGKQKIRDRCGSGAFLHDSRAEGAKKFHSPIHFEHKFLASVYITTLLCAF